MKEVMEKRIKIDAILEDASFKLADMAAEVVKLRAQVRGEMEEWREMQGEAKVFLEIYRLVRGVVRARMSEENSPRSPPETEDPVIFSFLSM